ncbi:MAG: hypothetical protein F4Y27_04415 [Acidimicrobiaceae bacterium]|nr:hypothetical protein [Acidimicrobiaceae bacterium]MYA73900.1 hypothetical protein [Acidimicrobiaceae bacterium]MYC43849.1 hypothetical protein [Acidimicrobiaceae bacterium]MYG54925.1 hypothetical protein [Acidimicrobiaceae bacterium]MYJ98548.1 hypothetical protein [Acidimicrobiaceae bacterium]
MRRDTHRDTQRVAEQPNQRDHDPRSPRIQHLPIGADERFYEHVCPTCGQMIDQSRHDHSDPSKFTEETEATGDASRVGPVKWFTVALLSIFAAALFIGWRGSPESSSAPEGSLPVTDIDPSEGAASDTGGDSESDSDTTVSANRSTAARHELASLVGRHRIAYVAHDGIAIINPASDSDPARIVAPEHANMNDLLAGFGSFVMFDQSGDTYGFELGAGSGDPTIYQLSTQGQVIAGENHSLALVVHAPPDPVKIYVGNASGVFMVRLEVPVGAALLDVPGLGVLVTSSTGETFVTTQGGFAHFADWPVIAANTTHHVEIRCVDSLACTPVLVDRRSGADSVLPTVLAGDLGSVTIAPDGTHLLLVNPATGPAYPDLLYDVAAEELVALTTEVRGAIAWSPNSSFVAWFEEASASQLSVLDVDTAQIDSVDLTDLKAPPRSSNALLFFP